MRRSILATVMLTMLTTSSVAFAGDIRGLVVNTYGGGSFSSLAPSVPASPPAGKDLLLYKVSIPTLTDAAQIWVELHCPHCPCNFGNLAVIEDVVSYADGGIMPSSVVEQSGSSCGETVTYQAHFQFSPPLQPGDTTATIGLAFPDGYWEPWGGSFGTNLQIRDSNGDLLAGTGFTGANLIGSTPALSVPALGALGLIALAALGIGLGLRSISPR